MSEISDYYQRRVTECDENINILKARRKTLRKGGEKDAVTKRIELLMVDKNNYSDALKQQLEQEGVSGGAISGADKG